MKNLGKKSKDLISGLSGVIVAKYKHLNGSLIIKLKQVVFQKLVIII